MANLSVNRTARKLRLRVPSALSGSGGRLPQTLGRTVMATSTLNVRFPQQSDGEHSEVSRIRNFAEDLDRRLQSEQVGSVQNPDSAVELVVVCARSGRQFGQVLAATRATLKRHNLLAEATLERR